MIEASSDFKSVSKLEKNRKMMEYMIGTIDQYVDDPRRQPSSRNLGLFRRFFLLTCFMFGKFLGNYLVILYLVIKVLYIVNCVGQLFLISVLLGRNYYIYGMSIFRDIVQGRGYADSEYFPRVTMCKFQVRELGLKNFSHEYNVQCVLPINLFNQQIFTFLWFWYLILLVINTSTLLIWIYRFIPRNQYNYAIRRVKLLKIRLMENSKVPKQGAGEATTTTTTASEKTTELTRKRLTSKRVKQGEEELDEVFEPSSPLRRRTDSFKNRHSGGLSMFPNIPAHFELHEINSFRHQSIRHTERLSSNFSGSTMGGDRQFPLINDYETYMGADSFCPKNYKAFVFDYLEADGMFMLRMIGSNSGDFVCTQVLHNLWKLFLYKRYVRSKGSSISSSSPSKNATGSGGGGGNSSENGSSTADKPKIVKKMTTTTTSKQHSGGGGPKSTTSVFKNENTSEDDNTSTAASTKMPSKSIMKTLKLKNAPKNRTIFLKLFRFGGGSSSNSKNLFGSGTTFTSRQAGPFSSKSARAANMSIARKGARNNNDATARSAQLQSEFNRFQSIKRVAMPRKPPTMAKEC